MPGTAYQKQVNGSLIQLNPVRQHLGGGVTADIVISSIGDPGGNSLEPLPPTINTGSSVMTSRTAATINWAAPNNTGRPPITEYRVYRETGGVTTLAGTTASTVLTLSVTGLPTATPEVIFHWTVIAVNADGPGLQSNIWTAQWQVPGVNQPLAPTGLARTAFTLETSGTTARTNLTWSVVADSTVTKQGIFEGTTLVRDNLGPTATSFVLDNLALGSTHTNLNVRRFNAWSATGSTAGWSAASNNLTFTVAVPPVSLMMTGCSDSENDHGGTEVRDGWREYTENSMLSRANRTGSQRPVFLAYSKNGAPFSGSYAATRQEVLDDLNSFYYTGGATSQVHSARWGIQLYWSNGNENSDKAPLGLPHSAAGIATFVDGQRGLYDAVHFVDPSTGSRRFPDAFAGSNPTQVHELDGIVQDWLHPSARYHDFVMWSMYPAGRGVNDTSLSRNPRWDWPSFNEAQRTSRQQGHLIRCFYRTAQAQAQARIDRGDPNYLLHIATGECGMAADPDDRAMRPYYAVHGMIGSMYLLAQQYFLSMDFALWWDNATGTNKVTTTAPHNILSDEAPNNDHLSEGTGAAAGNNSVATNPTTWVAWRDWRLYDKRQPGSSQPAQWAGKPANDNSTGTPI